jgi:hypothetical protein
VESSCSSNKKIQDVYILQNAVAVAARVETKMTDLAQQGSFGLFLARLDFFVSVFFVPFCFFWLILFFFVFFGSFQFFCTLQLFE